ncbi:TetR/AcrR family transcriptional regulator [Actinophytocola gossypii]|uniref:TetR family transcriptional regulator n=1 Tax=Actinophytocola gossypii TaxID=2812003 RepID=A0ABT2JBQ6_9PSEU|nr:TetR family transcriptional regulator [Actinophytocola gossypii]MCT2585302.1 TetR family transcriptional regulator [Actinophytocola gossypii]
MRHQDVPRRRGRRPGGTDTRAALLDAARAVFSEQGYDGATVRAIAARAEVDAAMVNHWFGSKEGLFAEAVLKLPFNPADVVERLLDGDVDGLGERIVRTFIGIWDTTGGGVFTALVRSITSHELAVHALRDFLVRNVVGKVLAPVAPDDAEFRATLVASQLVGMGLVRYVARFEPLASADVDTMVAAVAPTLQRYITDTIR